MELKWALSRLSLSNQVGIFQNDFLSENISWPHNSLSQISILMLTVGLENVLT